MIKYLTIKNRLGKDSKVAILVCEECRKEFQVSEKIADQGRKYCDKKCMSKGRGFAN